MIDEYPGFNMRFVPLLPSANIPNTEKACITTVVGLYHLTQFLAPPQIRKKKKMHKIGPSSKETVQQIFATVSDFWNVLKRHARPIREVLSSNPALELASRYRRQDGGNILFRTVGLAAFARAARAMMDSGSTAELAVTKLVATVPMELNSELWREVLWRPETETMLHKYVRLAQNVMLYRAGAYPGTKKSLEDDYFKITGRNYHD